MLKEELKPIFVFVNFHFSIILVCHYSCNTCATQNTTCTSCLTTNNRMMASGTCPCNKYYFEITNQPECLPCHWTCDTCKSLDSCDSCLDMSNREVNYAQYQDYFCNCKIGYAEDLSSNACLRIIMIL